MAANKKSRQTAFRYPGLMLMVLLLRTAVQYESGVSSLSTLEWTSGEIMAGHKLMLMLVSIASTLKIQYHVCPWRIPVLSHLAAGSGIVRPPLGHVC